MASLLRTLTFTTGSIAVGASTNRNDSIVGNAADIVKIKVVPSNISSSELTSVFIYKHNTFLAADLVYSTIAFAGNLVDPIETDGITTAERNEGFVAYYEDLDATQQLHMKIVNSGTVTKTYTVIVEYVTKPITTNISNGAKEVNFWNYDPTATVAFDFRQATGVSTSQQLFDIEPTGVVELVASYTGSTLSDPGTVALRNNAGALEASQNGGAWGPIGAGGGGTITGSSTTNTIPKMASATSITSSTIIDNGTNILLNLTGTDLGLPGVVIGGKVNAVNSIANAQLIQMYALGGGGGAIINSGHTGVASTKDIWLTFDNAVPPYAKLTTNGVLQIVQSYAGATLSDAGTIALRNNAGTLETSQNGSAWSPIGNATISGSCATVGGIPKMASSTSITCSNLIDNGTNILLNLASTDLGLPGVVVGGKVNAVNATTNAQLIQMYALGGGGGAIINSGHTGAGVTKDIWLSFDNSVPPSAKLTTNGVFALIQSYNGATLSDAGTVALRNNAGAFEVSANGNAWTPVGGGGTIGGSCATVGGIPQMATSTTITCSPLKTVSGNVTTVSAQLIANSTASDAFPITANAGVGSSNSNVVFKINGVSKGTVGADSSGNAFIRNATGGNGAVTVENGTGNVDLDGGNGSQTNVNIVANGTLAGKLLGINTGGGLLELISAAGSFIQLTGTTANIGLNSAQYSDMQGGVSIGLATTAPTGNPAFGFLLYVDPGDNKLKVRGASGTVTPLANP